MENICMQVELLVMLRYGEMDLQVLQQKKKDF